MSQSIMWRMIIEESDGASQGPSSTRSIQLPLTHEKQRLILGRNQAKCDVVFDKDKSISREHCELVLRKDGKSIAVTNVKGQYGVKVDGVSVTDEAVLDQSMEVRIGDKTTFRVVAEAVGGGDPHPQESQKLRKSGEIKKEKQEQDNDKAVLNELGVAGSGKEEIIQPIQNEIGPQKSKMAKEEIKDSWFRCAPRMSDDKIREEEARIRSAMQNRTKMPKEEREMNVPTITVKETSMLRKRARSKKVSVEDELIEAIEEEKDKMREDEFYAENMANAKPIVKIVEIAMKREGRSNKENGKRFNERGEGSYSGLRNFKRFRKNPTLSNGLKREAGWGDEMDGKPVIKLEKYEARRGRQEEAQGSGMKVKEEEEEIDYFQNEEKKPAKKVAKTAAPKSRPRRNEVDADAGMDVEVDESSAQRVQAAKPAKSKAGAKSRAPDDRGKDRIFSDDDD